MYTVIKYRLAANEAIGVEMLTAEELSRIKSAASVGILTIMSEVTYNNWDDAEAVYSNTVI